MNMQALSPAQRRAIDRAKELLVTPAETLLDDFDVKPTKDFGESQLRNLLKVAAETESPAAVLNFIRYQMGRDKKKEPQAWARGPEGNRLGDRFITELGDGSEATVGKALATVPDLAEAPVLRQLARIELMRHFIGFASRHMRYLKLKASAADEEDQE
jgi:hypothetical protein